MSTNCLVTKLKGVVDNDNIPVFRHLAITAKRDNEITTLGRQFSIQSPQVLTIQSELGFYQDASLTTLIGNEVTTVANAPTTVYIPNSVGKIDVSNKYAIRRLELGGGLSIKAADIRYINAESALSFLLVTFRTTAIEGNLSGLGIPSEFINISGIIPAGDTEDIAALKCFTIDGKSTLNLEDSKVVGELGLIKDITGASTKLAVIKDTTDSRLGKITLNMNDLEGFTGIEQINLMHNTVTGNIATGLGACTGLTSINIGGHTQAEDLKNLFDALHTNGKTSGSIVCWMGSNKTLNGGTWTNGSTVTFTANGWSVA